MVEKEVVCMKTLKCVLKLFSVAGACFGVAGLTLVKKSILVFKLKSQYKNLRAINQQIQKLYRVIFNPYRISNGLRPCLQGEYRYSAADLERCHQLFVNRRQEAGRQRA